MDNFQQGLEKGKEKAKKYVKKKIGKVIRKAIIKIIKKLLMKLVMVIVKAVIAAVGALVATIGLPLAIILAILIIIGGAMFFLAPSLGLIDGDSPRSQQEIRSELQALIVDSSTDPNYRPPFELISSMDTMRIIQEDLNPWEFNFSPIVEKLSPDLTYQDFNDTYEIKTVTTTKKEVTHMETQTQTTYTWGQIGTETQFICTEDEIETMPINLIEAMCYEEVPIYGDIPSTTTVEVPVTETVEEVSEQVSEEKKKVTFLKTAHAWNRFETFYYKENSLNKSFELIDVKEEGDTKIETYKRKTKEWVFDSKDFEHNYTKFDEAMGNLNLEESAMKLLVEALKENNIPLDGYMGTYFDSFIDGGMALMIPQEYMEIYKAAEEKYKVGWNYIAAIHYIETKFSTIETMVSSVGAIGHFQFMKCTWTGWGYPGCGGVGNGDIPDSDLKNPSIIVQYNGLGVDANGDGLADPFDLEDAAFTAANYLNRSGFESNPKGAIKNYNHSDKYVADVLHYAELFNSSQGAIPPVSAGSFTRPASGPITSDFGPRSGGMHYGVDIGKRENVVPIVAAANGTVSKSYVSSSYGECIFIKHNIDGQEWETVYAHMVSGSRRVKVGDQVQKGQIIGLMGETGQADGAHLHFEIHRGSWNIQKSNAISPTSSGLIQW